MASGVADTDKVRSLSGAVAALRSRLIPSATLFVILWALSSSGFLAPLERELSDQRFGWITRSATDSITVVTIDSQSLKQLDQWPWPREHYARAIDWLRTAGARLILFDVNFSGRSTPSGDAALADAISRADGTVVLPTFLQPFTGRSRDREFVETRPNVAFQDNAVFASVNFIPEANGQVRRAYYGFSVADAYRQSVHALLAGTPYGATDSFWIDFGIQASTIERISFWDVLNGTFDPDLVKDRHILIGATALELGDQFAAPVYVLMPGVIIHALSYESIVQGRTLVKPRPALSLAAAFFVILLLCQPSRRCTWRASMATHFIVFNVTIFVPVLLQIYAPISLQTASILTAQLLCILYRLGFEAEQRALDLITAQRAAARQQALMARVVQDSSDGIVVTDASGKVVMSNDQAATLLEVSDSDLNGRDLATIVPGFPRHDGAALRDETHEEQHIHPISSEFIVPHDGGERVLEIVGNAIQSPPSARGNAAGDTVETLHHYSLRNVTARKRLEAAEKEAKDAAIQASEAKTQLIANMSHELRTPLNAIIGFSEIYEHQLFGPIENDKYLDYARDIRASGQRLLGVVNDILEVSRLDSDEVELDPSEVDLQELVTGCLVHFREQISASPRTVTVENLGHLPNVRADYRLLKQVLIHLLSNALKFTADGGNITVSADIASSDVEISVADSGVGCDPALLDRLTEAFFQADSTLSRTHEGSGLGLFLTKRHVDLHGGTLRLTLPEGGGFTAKVLLPGAVLAQAPDSGGNTPSTDDPVAGVALRGTRL